jgi:hypothetical protein
MGDVQRTGESLPYVWEEKEIGSQIQLTPKTEASWPKLFNANNGMILTDFGAD